MSAVAPNIVDCENNPAAVGYYWHVTTQQLVCKYIGLQTMRGHKA